MSQAPMGYIIFKKIGAYRCLRCGHEWIPRIEMKKLENGHGMNKDKPKICPKCKSAYWDEAKEIKNSI